MLWYVKGGGPNEHATSSTMGDFIESTRPGTDKAVHEWKQSTVEGEYIIKNLTLENHSTVLDPMMGSGIICVCLTLFLSVIFAKMNLHIIIG